MISSNNETQPGSGIGKIEEKGQHNDVVSLEN